MATVQRFGSPFLEDSATGDIIGIKDEDGGERMFVTATSQGRGVVLDGGGLDAPIFDRTMSTTIYCTWATLPPASEHPLGMAYVADVGIKGSIWVSNGAEWGLLGGSVVLGYGNTAKPALTGVTTSASAVNLIIPAGLLGNSGTLEVYSRHTIPSNANTKTFRHVLGGTTFNDPQVTTSASAHVTTIITNRNDPAVQIGSNGGPSLSSNSNAWRTGTVNTALDQVLTISQQLANAADSAVLETWSVRLIRP